VRSTHSAQGNPGTILEVRRILYEHLGTPCGLECAVIEPVDEAAASMGTREPAPAAIPPVGVQAP